MQKVPQKHAEGCDPLDSRGRFKALPEKILAVFFDGTSRNRFFAQNGGEKALNRCDVPVLQRKDLERTAKEWPCSLVDSRLWLGANGMCLGWKRIALDSNKERFARIESFWFVKKLAFSAHAKPTQKNSFFSARQNFNFPPQQN